MSEIGPLALEVALPVAEEKAPARAQEAGFQIPTLDGIRAVSFFIVFLAHAGLERFVPGYFGLTLFFFLSGYLITTLLRMEHDRTGTCSLRQFYLRRVLRIFPPFYLVMAVFTALTLAGVLNAPLDWGAVAAQAGHLTNYYIVRHGWWNGMAPGTWVYWSLAVEEHFYLVFPLLYLLLRRRLGSGSRIAAALLVLCGVVLLWRCALVFGFHVPKERTYVASDTRVDSILFGCILALWNNPALDPPRIGDRALQWLWVPAGLLLIALSFAVRQHWFDQTFRYTLQGLGLIPLFIAAVRYWDRGPFRLLNTAPLKYLGVLSYSLYLLHTAALWACEQWTDWPTPVRSVATLATIIVVADLIYRAVERPCGAMRRRLSRAIG